MGKKFLPIVVAALLAVALVVPAAVIGAPEALATRTLPASVAPGADFDVGIEASGCGIMGEVAETLPSGFSYVGTDSTDVIVTPGDSTVRFTFMGDAVSFDYTVTASATAGTYSFSGVVKDEDKIEYAIGGDADITVVPPEGTLATRTLPASVAPGADFDVGIEASGCGAMGEVAETLPSGFSYVGTDSTDVIVTPGDSTVKFTFIGDSVSFTYTVTASATAGTYSFSGVVKDEDKIEYAIGGDTDIQVTAVPEQVELEFSGSLAKDERAYLTTIPEGAAELDITLEATADIDLELYDGDTFVIGWKAIISSSGSTTGTYQGDTFAYSGWYGGEEYIRADGPLSRAYDLKVYGFRAGDYTVTVSYIPAAPPNPPPAITIDVPATVALGNPVTVTVSAADPDGVRIVYFMVSSPWSEWTSASSSSQYEDVIEYVTSFGDEASLTFTPGWAGTYTVDAWACDELENCTLEATPETDTFVVSE